MDRSSVISLVSESYTQDTIGQYIATETLRQVYCDVRSMYRSEWFEAGRDGLQPAYVFTMFAPDYSGEKIVEYNGKRYGVYRTYVGRNETLELYVEEKGGRNVSTDESEAGTAGNSN